MGHDEAKQINRLLVDSNGGNRGEVFRLLKSVRRSDMAEAMAMRMVILEKASPLLRPTVNAIIAYEELATLLEGAFGWILYLSSMAGARAVGVADFARKRQSAAIARSLPAALERAYRALECATPDTQTAFASLAAAFGNTSGVADLFESVLRRHAAVQKAKPPDGKREWFERSSDNGAFVRVPYRLNTQPEVVESWNRPYRIGAALSFHADLRKGMT
jgi:hypothetical protein